MYIEGYSAWITIPGHELREFDAAVDNRSRKATCWIPSEEGMRFSVHWKDHAGSIPTATFIKLDGYTVPGHFLMGEGEAERDNIRVGITTVRPFTFARVPHVNIIATPTDTDPTELGTIIVKIKRVSIIGKHRSNAPIEPRPPVGGRHSVAGEAPVGIGYGHEEMGHCQMPTTWKVKPWDKRNPGTYVTFIFRYRSRKFLISQGIMSESDDIYTNIHAQSKDASASPEPEDESQYAESVPPSPTESSAPPTPALSATSGPPSPRHEPNVRPPRLPTSSRSFSLGEPPRPSSAFPQASPNSRTSRNPATPLPHPIVPSHGFDSQGRGSGTRPNAGRRVVSYDIGTARDVNAHTRSASITGSFSPGSSGVMSTGIYMSGAVSYYNIAGSSSFSNPYELGTTDPYDLSTATRTLAIGSAEHYDPRTAILYDNDPHASYACDADPNAYLSSGYPGATDPNTNHASTAGPYDRSNVIRTYDGPRAANAVHYYGQAQAMSHLHERETREETGVLARATENLKHAEYNFPEMPDAPNQRLPGDPAEKRPYSKTRPGPAMYLGQGPHKELALKAQASPDGSPTPPDGNQGAPGQKAPSTPRATSPTSGSSGSTSMAPATRSRTKEAEAKRVHEEAARAGQVRQVAARPECSPSVPIPKNVAFVEGEGEALHAPTHAPATPASRKPSGSSRRQPEERR